ncbi:M24 family metallopeptidase [Paracoccus wurundjeri]|uniref:M24 family metallopeptidase n=1 Tax=Paracoccus onubensis TaxID=1675788 RepID=UPI00273158F7|nr:Xaa-Pro peptidase family protein [Paracoccus onubensis]
MTTLSDMNEVWGNSDLALARRARVFSDPTAPDAILCFDPANVAYLSGYASMSSDMNPAYRIGVLATADSARLIVSAGDGPAALECICDPSMLFRYGEFHVVTAGQNRLGAARPAVADFGAAVRDALDSWDPGRQRRIGIEGETSDLVDGRSCFDARPLLRRSRLVKLPHEIAIIRYCLSLMQRGIEAALDAAAPGVNERDLAALVSAEITRGGGVPRSIAVTSGPRAANVDAFASGRRLAIGDVLRIDLGATFRGYWGDMARSAFIGLPSSEQEQCFAAISAGVEAERQVIRAGITASEVFAAAIAATRDAGLPQFARHHVGHGLGLNITEAPLLALGDHTVLQSGMVLCIETPLYRETWGGMMTEDVVVVTENGNTPLTDLSRDLRTCGGVPCSSIA